MRQGMCPMKHSRNPNREWQSSDRESRKRRDLKREASRERKRREREW